MNRPGAETRRQLPLDGGGQFNATGIPVIAVPTCWVLKPQGLLFLLDLARHEQEWLREQLADQWLGFEEKTLEEWMAAAGLRVVRMEHVGGSHPELPVVLAVAVKGGA